MNAVQEILNDIPLEQLAAQVGSDPQTVQQLSAQLIPALIGGMSANAADADGERSLTNALNDHASSDLLSGGVDLDQVDTNDGEAIVNNVFGASTPQVTQALGQQFAGGNPELVQKLLRVLAPIVLAYLANKLLSGAGFGDAPKQGGSGGGIIGDIIGSLTGKKPAQESAQAPAQRGGSLQDMLIDMLGGAFGGGGAQAPAQAPQQAPKPQFEQPTRPADGPAPAQIPIDEPAPSASAPRRAPSGGDLLGEILGGLLGQGRRT